MNIFFLPDKKNVIKKMFYRPKVTKNTLKNRSDANTPFSHT